MAFSLLEARSLKFVAPCSLADIFSATAVDLSGYSSVIIGLLAAILDNTLLALPVSLG